MTEASTVAFDLRFAIEGQHTLTRGTGRFARQQLEALIALNYNVIAILADQEHATLLPANVKAAVLPVTGQSPSDSYLFTEAFNRFLIAIGADLYFNPAPQALVAWQALRVDAVPSVYTMLDYIPMLFKDAYQPTTPYQLSWLGTANADSVLCISEATQRDCLQYVAPRGATFVGYPVADDELFYPDFDTVDLPIDYRGSFMLSVSGVGWNKNLGKLIQAVGQLPTSIKQRYALVVACSLDAWSKETYERLVAQSNANVIFTGGISDSELAALYNHASLYVHASLYEGFGLPILEAMKCARPVVVANNSSMPEIVGDGAWLFNANDVEDIEVVITQALTSNDLSGRGIDALERSRLFDKEQLHNAIKQCCEHALEGVKDA